MGEIKSVKVDNWGVFFLQKLQNFFNKTDYCDLTLQFNDNSQLKVHRLVLSACTDYFNVLEQTCEMIEDVLIMPLELQADVVVPIVNFMYTGTLEFELRMYGKLLKTARDMNMTVLLKLLEAHRRTMERNPTQPTNRNTARNSYQKKIPVVPGTSGSNATQRRVRISDTSKYKSIKIKPITSYFQGTNTTQIIQTKYAPARVVKGPSRFDYPPEGKVLPPETFESSFDTISYESKPLICKEEPDSEDYENLVQKSSPFEELRRGYNNNKRPASAVSLSVFESPPEKKPNIEDVKEYAEQQRVRKQIAQEFDDENEYDETLDDEFHNDDDDEDYIPPQSYQKQTKQPSQQKQTQQKNIQQQTPIVIKQENNRPTIVVKDSPNSNVNHAKIISEVLRKYPHLVKNNKNIKLKILPKSTNTGKNETQKIILKKEPIDQRPVAVTSLPPPSTKHATYPSAVQRSSATAGTSLLQQKTTQQSKANPVKSTSTASTASSSSSSSTTASTSTQPRRIDSKTMHSLIAMGAENRTGPWLCLECGVNGRPISIPSYRGFRRHLINTHGKRIDPRLCEHCGWRSTNNRELYHHMLVEHKIKPPSTFNFPKCELCDAVLLSYSELEKHISESHEEGIEVNQNCIYCNKTFANEGLLYAHMKSQHKERAKEDGVIDFSDEENAFESDSQYQSDGGHDSKIKILSDISLPKNIPIIQAEDNAPGTTITIPPEALETNERLIDASQGPRFVNADGKEMELTEEQRREIIAQLENQDHGAVVMVLNDDTINQDETQTTSTSASTSTQMPKSDKSSKSQKELAVVEKDLHKPRKTKHTIRANVDDNEDSEDIIEWLDEESGNIMKVPLSKFSKMGDTEEEDEEDTARETEEGESADEGREDVKKAKDDKSLSINDKNEQEDETTSDSVKDKKHDDEEEDEEEVEEEEEEDDEKEEENKTEKVKDKKTVESKSSKETKSKNKGEMSKALETLKILTGDWTDEEDDAEKKKNEKKNVSTEKSKQAQNKEKEINKEEEILFETIAVAETSTEDVDEKDKKLRKSRSKSRESDINEKDDDNKNDKEKEDNDNDKDDKDDSMDIDTSITTVHDDKLLKDVEDDATDDDMKIIEELKNYEAEQLAAEKEAILKKEEKTLEERLLRRKSKSKSKSASPAISENSNQSDGTSDSNSRGGDKPRKRGRPRKTLSLENQKSKNDNDENNEIVTETEKQKDSDDDENKEKKSESDADNGGNENERDIAAEIKAQLETTDENSQSQSSTKKDEAEEEEEVVEEEEEEDENGKNKSEEVATEKEENEKNKTVADAIAETTELMTKAEIRNLISDWGDDEEDDEEL